MNTEHSTPSEPIKPIVKLLGENANTMNLLAICTKALKRSGQPDRAKELTARIFDCGSYHEALHIMSEYCEIH